MTSDVVLLDANVLIAAHFEDHVHHALTDSWLRDRRFATTPSTQGSLLRYTLRVAGPDAAITVVETLSTNPRHEFWPDDGPFTVHMLAGLRGHRQLTDSYLAAAAQANRTRLVTFDGGLKQLRPDVVDLLLP